MNYRAIHILCIVLVGAASLPLREARAHTMFPVRAHKFYASLTEGEYNEETKKLECSLRVFADDIELVLTKRTGRAVYLDRTPDVSRLLRDYLQERFEVRAGEGTVMEVKWIGMDTRVDSAWLFFEIPLPAGIGGVSLRNRVLLDLYGEQVNTTVVKAGGKRHEFIFKREDEGWRTIVETMNAER